MALGCLIYVLVEPHFHRLLNKNFKNEIFDSYDLKSSGIFEEIDIMDVSQLKKTCIHEDDFLSVEPFISSVNKSYDGDVGGYLKNIILKHCSYE